MENEQNSQNQSETLNRTIALTAIRTVYAAVVAAALVCTLIVLLFPYGAMNFYLGMGNRHRALESAESYLKQYPADGDTDWNSRYAGVRYRAAQLAGDLFTGETKAPRKELYAQKTVELTEAYFKVNDVSMKNEQIDAFNVSVDAGINPILHPGLYSVADQMNVREYQAKMYLGDFGDIVWPLDRSLDFDTLLNSTLLTENFTVTDQTVLAWMSVFNQLNAYIDAAFIKIGVDKLPDLGDNTLGEFAFSLKGNAFELFYRLGEDKGFTKLYDLLTKQFAVFSDFVNKMPRDSAAAALKACYCIKAISGFATRMDTVCYILYAQAYPIDVPAEAFQTWRAYDVYRYGTGEFDSYYMSSYYQNTLLPAYVRFYRQENPS